MRKRSGSVQRTASAEPHLLEPIVFAELSRGRFVNQRTFAKRLAGSECPSKRYIDVAADVLDFMERQGKLWSNDQGDYRTMDTCRDPDDEPDPQAEAAQIPACGFRPPTPENAPEAFRAELVPAQHVLDQVEQYLESRPEVGAYVVCVVPILADGTAERWQDKPAKSDGSWRP